MHVVANAMNEELLPTACIAGGFSLLLIPRHLVALPFPCCRRPLPPSNTTAACAATPRCSNGLRARWLTSMPRPHPTKPSSPTEQTTRSRCVSLLVVGVS
jgi:hypothetical protein